MKKILIWGLIVVFMLSISVSGIGCKEEAMVPTETSEGEAAPAEEEAAL